jgi:hypothetical protein
MHLRSLFWVSTLAFTTLTFVLTAAASVTLGLPGDASIQFSF